MYKKCKKIQILLLCFFSVGMLLFGLEPVEAAKEKVGVCNYKLSDKNIGGVLQGTSLSVTIYNDGSTGNRAIKVGKWSETPTGGLLLNDTGVSLQYKKMFDKNGKFYKAYEKRKNCPQMQFIWRMPNQLYFNVGEITEDTQGNPSDTITPEIQEYNSNSGQTIENEKVICTKKSRIKNFGDYVKVQFITDASGRKFVVDEGGRGKPSATMGNIASGTTVSYSIRASDADIYFNEATCAEAKMFAHAIDGMPSQIEFQTEKPDPAQNGSYGAEDAEKDTGTGELAGSKVNDRQDDFTGKKEKKDACDIIDKKGELYKALKQIVGYIQIGTIFLVLILGVIDLTGAVGSDKDDALKKAVGRFAKRMIAAALVFLVPTIINFIFNIINLSSCGGGEFADLFKW
ncbi:MAG: hypothetical protein PHN72_02990 [Bacilli bacterium]|nr:hypothetical protein [Bacilli bacterium]